MVRCPDCETVNPAGAKVCEKCGTAIALVCERCNAGNPSRARFCCSCGARFDHESDTGPSSIATSERRQMTVMFCDLVGSSALSRKLDPEDMQRVLDAVHSHCEEVSRKRNGHLAEKLGDGALVYFGFPVAAEDAPRQAVAAGLEVLRLVSAMSPVAGQKLALRVGIHTGPVVVGRVGTDPRAVGETPNLAKRVQEAAPENSVVMSLATQGLVKGFFDCEVLGTYQLKGFPEPAELYRAVQESGRKTRLEAAMAEGLTPLVGRKNECSILERAWQNAASGGSPVVLLIGEPGIGKSRLVLELGALVKDRASTIVALRCSEHETTSAFHAVLDGMKRQVGIVAGEPADATRAKLRVALEPLGLGAPQLDAVATLMGVPVDPAPAPDALRKAALEALRAWFLGPCEAAPRLVVIEDLHWADPSTLDLLKLALEGQRAPRLLTLVTTRPELTSRTGFEAPWRGVEKVEVVELHRLEAAETRKLIAHVVGDKPLPSDVVDRVASQSEGVPLFLEEITKALMESGALRETRTGYELPGSVRDGVISATLRDSLMGRLDRLGNGKPIAQLAAVLGREFPNALLECVWQKVQGASAASLKEGLDRLVRAQLLRPIGGPSELVYQFKHALLQKEAYDSLPKRSTLLEYHRSVADTLVKDFPARATLQPEIVAHHHAQAEQPSEAAEFWDKAGQHAMGASAYAEAISHFSQAIEQLQKTASGPSRSRREIDIRSRLGVTLIATTGFSSTEVHKTFSRAAELCDELGDDVPMRVVYGTWAVNIVRSDFSSTNRMVPTMTRAAQSRSDRAGALIANTTLGAWFFFRGDHNKAIEHCRAAIELRDSERAKEEYIDFFSQHGFEGYLYPDIYLAWARAVAGDIAGARNAWQIAADLSERIGVPYVTAGVLGFGGFVFRELGDTSTAARLAQQTLDICEKNGFAGWRPVALSVLGNCLLAEGRAEEAIATLRDSLKEADAFGGKLPLTRYLAYLAEALLAKGSIEAAIGTLEEGLAMARANVDQNFEPEILRLLGQARLRQGNRSVARECYTAALELARTHGAKLFELQVATDLARLLIEEDDKAGARQILGGIRAFFEGADISHHLKRADEVLSQL